MNINYKQSQFELFPASAGHTEKEEKPRYFFSSLTLSLENVAVVGIFVLLSVIVSFSFGVERGKRIAVATPKSIKEIPAPTPAVNSKNVFSPSDNKVITMNTKAVTTKQLVVNKTALPIVAAQNKNQQIAKLLPAVNSPAVARQDIKLSSGAYTIQVASYKKIEVARREAGRLTGKGHDIFVLPKGNYAIICVGKFSNEGQAKALLSKLRQTYKDCLVRRL
ncbi:MAG: SPOR domain-containing protein [Candidatus Omnitrophota bacterium]